MSVFTEESAKHIREDVHDDGEDSGQHTFLGIGRAAAVGLLLWLVFLCAIFTIHDWNGSL